MILHLCLNPIHCILFLNYRFPGSSARENWVRIIVDAVDYSRESLRTRLNLKQVAGKSEKHMGSIF